MRERDPLHNAPSKKQRDIPKKLFFSQSPDKSEQTPAANVGDIQKALYFFYSNQVNLGSPLLTSLHILPDRGGAYSLNIVLTSPAKYST